MLPLDPISWQCAVGLTVESQCFTFTFDNSTLQRVFVWHFVAGAAPSYELRPEAGYRVIDSSRSGVVRVHYATRGGRSVNHIQAPNAFVVEVSDLGQLDLSAYYSFADAYYRHLLLHAVRTVRIYVLIRPRLIYGHSHRLTAHDIALFDGTTFQTVPRKGRRVSALDVIMSGYQQLRMNIVQYQRTILQKVHRVTRLPRPEPPSMDTEISLAEPIEMHIRWADEVLARTTPEPRHTSVAQPLTEPLEQRINRLNSSAFPLMNSLGSRRPRSAEARIFRDKPVSKESGRGRSAQVRSPPTRAERIYEAIKYSGREDCNALNGYLVRQRHLHDQICAWGSLDLDQRVGLVRQVLQLLLLPDFCPVCHIDRSAFGSKRKRRKRGRLSSTRLTSASPQRDSFLETLDKYRRYFAEKDNERKAGTTRLAALPAVPRRNPSATQSISFAPASTRSVSLETRKKRGTSTFSSRAPSVQTPSRTAGLDPHSSSVAYASNPAPQHRTSRSSLTRSPSPDRSISPLVDSIAVDSGSLQPHARMIGKFKHLCQSYLVAARQMLGDEGIFLGLQELIQRYMCTVFSTYPFATSVTAVYCPECEVFLGCSERCAAKVRASHAATCTYNLGVTYLLHASDKDVEECCRERESDVSGGMPVIDTAIADSIRYLLETFDEAAERDLKYLSQAIGKPKVREDDSAIIHEFRQMPLGRVALSDAEIDRIAARRTEIMMRLDQTIAMKNATLQDILLDETDATDMLDVLLSTALGANDEAEAQTTIQALITLHGQASNKIVAGIKRQDAELGHVFFAFIDHLRRQYHLEVARLLTLQQQCAEERKKIAAFGPRVFSLLESFKLELLQAVKRVPILSFQSYLCRLEDNPSECKYRDTFDALTRIVKQLDKGGRKGSRKPSLLECPLEGKDSGEFQGLLETQLQAQVRSLSSEYSSSLTSEPTDQEPEQGGVARRIPSRLRGAMGLNHYRPANSTAMAFTADVLERYFAQAFRDDPSTPLRLWMNYEVAVYLSPLMVQSDRALLIRDTRYVLEYVQQQLAASPDFRRLATEREELLTEVARIKSEIKRGLQAARKAKGVASCKVTDEEVEHEYLLLHGSPFQGYALIYPKHHSPYWLTDSIESIKVVLDSLSPLGKHLQKLRNKSAGTALRLRRLLREDKKALRRQTAAHATLSIAQSRLLRELERREHTLLRQQLALRPRAPTPAPCPSFNSPNHSFTQPHALSARPSRKPSDTHAPPRARSPARSPKSGPSSDLLASSSKRRLRAPERSSRGFSGQGSCPTRSPADQIPLWSHYDVDLEEPLTLSSIMLDGQMSNDSTASILELRTNEDVDQYLLASRQRQDSRTSEDLISIFSTDESAQESVHSVHAEAMELTTLLDVPATGLMGDDEAQITETDMIVQRATHVLSPKWQLSCVDTFETAGNRRLWTTREPSASTEDRAQPEVIQNTGPFPGHLSTELPVQSDGSLTSPTAGEPMVEAVASVSKAIRRNSAVLSDHQLLAGYASFLIEKAVNLKEDRAKEKEVRRSPKTTTLPAAEVTNGDDERLILPRGAHLQTMLPSMRRYVQGTQAIPHKSVKDVSPSPSPSPSVPSPGEKILVPSSELDSTLDSELEILLEYSAHLRKTLDEMLKVVGAGIPSSAAYADIIGALQGVYSLKGPIIRLFSRFAAKSKAYCPRLDSYSIHTWMERVSTLATLNESAAFKKYAAVWKELAEQLLYTIHSLHSLVATVLHASPELIGVQLRFPTPDPHVSLPIDFSAPGSARETFIYIFTELLSYSGTSHT
ncbi:hypothetical protein GMRT_13945 [Giardia muris]|uniref:Uncharacterized protein n=1 Tax=Giardia muris TaxID=5742 RepID=A0A4Z1T234_GIAMU|nr:hypothetical protein GMRT_13945 [Giardia muris]|eukprot:TNJ26471.1 hypothetical protein GMRT_13945 [Giardia muris]